jgi:restriction endonuclease S subunit
MKIFYCIIIIIKQYRGQSVNLYDITTIRTGLVLSRKKAKLHSDIKHYYKQITLKSFSDSITLQTQFFDDFISIEEIDETYISKVGDIVVRLREPNTAVYINEKSAGLVIPSLFAIVRIYDQTVDNAFLAYYLNSKGIGKVLERDLKGTTISMIKTKDLGNLELNLPPVEVQKNIVRLMALSEKEIVLLDKLREEKQHYTQAVLDTIIKRNKEKN